MLELSKTISESTRRLERVSTILFQLSESFEDCGNRILADKMTAYSNIIDGEIKIIRDQLDKTSIEQYKEQQGYLGEILLAAMGKGKNDVA